MSRINAYTNSLRINTIIRLGGVLTIPVLKKWGEEVYELKASPTIQQVQVHTGLHSMNNQTPIKTKTQQQKSTLKYHFLKSPIQVINAR